MKDSKRLEQIANRHNLSVDDVRCYGCRFDTRYPFCEQCKMSKCSVEKGINFCIECKEFPCDELKHFQAERPHRIELWQAQKKYTNPGTRPGTMKCLNIIVALTVGL